MLILPRGATSSAAVPSEITGFDDLLRPAASTRGWRSWLRFAGPATSIAIVAALIAILGGTNLGRLWHLLPTHPAFWLSLGVCLSVQPLCDFAIFRRLWGLPPSAITALYRKSAINEVVAGYLGDFQFYAWARRHVTVEGSPFGAVKDVAVLSAMTGNFMTLAFVLAAVPFVGQLDLGAAGPALAGSVAIILASSLAIGLLRGRVFSLPAPILRRIAFVHLGRIVAMSLLVALLWHFVLPTVSAKVLLMLVAGRQLVTRLPLLPNKDLVFAAIAALFVADAPSLVAATALVATLMVLGQALIGGALGIAELIGRPGGRD